MKKTIIFILFTVLLSTMGRAQELDRSIVVKNQFKVPVLYQNGHRMSFRDIKYVTSQDPEAYYYAKRAHRFNAISNMVGFAGTALFVGGMWYMTEPKCIDIYKYPNLTGFLNLGRYVGLGMAVAWVPMHRKARKKALKAAETYNAHLLQTSFWDNTELQFGLTGNGVGVALCF